MKLLRKLSGTKFANALRKPKNWFVERRAWNARIRDVALSSDNTRLPRVANAGQIRGGWQTMHNGLEVAVDGYYGNGITRMLKVNRGCHEPQEEIVFAEVLRNLPSKPVMIECGAYWAFYSMWFLKARPAGRAFMIEPDLENMKVGQKNFQHNKFQGDFENAGIGENDAILPDGLKIISIPSFMKSRKLERADILHMDIQGAELGALRGARHLLQGHCFDYIFVSTHSEELHECCLLQLRDAAYRIDVSITPEKSCSVDGVIVATSPDKNIDQLPMPAEKLISTQS